MSAKPAPAVQPALGSPPSIEWIGVDRLAVDETYQRSCANPASEALIARIAARWDWRLFQPLACARRAEGAIVVIDGQHRLLGARRRGDIPHLPCIVGQFETVADEATAFAAMNRQRKAMSTLDLYRAQIAAGEPDAVQALGVVTDVGLGLSRHTNPNNLKPREIVCFGGVVRAIKRYGGVPTRRALTAIAGAYPDERLVYAGTLLDPVARILRSGDVERVRAVIASKPQGYWRTLSLQHDVVTKVTPSGAVEAAILSRLGHPAPASAATPAVKSSQGWAPLPASPPKPRKTFEEELEAARNGTATFVERTIIPSRPPTELLGGSTLA